MSDQDPPGAFDSPSPQELDAELTDSVRVHCPYCGESSELPVDPGGGSRQEYIEDCPVCCQPWAVTLTIDTTGVPTAATRTLDGTEDG